MDDTNLSNEARADEVLQDNDLPLPFVLRCMKCGMINPTTDRHEECRGCGKMFYQVKYYRSQRKQYETVRCSSCGRIMENVSSDSVECELCGKLLDVMAHRVGMTGRPHYSALKGSIAIAIWGLIFMGIVAILSLIAFSRPREHFSYQPLLICGGFFFWLAAFPFLIHCYGKASREEG